MDYKFLHKVVGQIVSETEIDYVNGRMYTPFTFHSSNSFRISSLSHLPTRLLSSLTKHCKNIYGLNEQEIKYVWKEYREIIIDKLPY